MSVLSIPDYRGGNPYQSNLEAALQEDVTYGDKEALFPVCREIVSEDVTVVHLHWLSAFFEGDTVIETVKRFTLFLLWLVLIRVRNLPVVWTLHNVQFHDSTYPRAERAFKRWFIMNMCDRYIVHCEAVREEFIREYDLPPSIQDRIDIIPHGHYVQNYENEISKDEARESLDIPESSTVFLFFGMISPYKGIQSLIDAFREISLEDSHLVIAGNPSSESFGASLRSQCRTDDNIHTDFRFVPDEEVQRFMNAADAVVLPYRNISTSGSAILAMSFGKALVVPTLGCLPELLHEEGAVLYEPDRDGALESALETAAQRDLEAMGRYNESAAVELDWESIAEQTLETYSEVR